VISHLKAEHRMGRNYLAHHACDAINAVLAAAGYNFHLLLSRHSPDGSQYEPKSVPTGEC
jgi:hypothetical protein